MASSNVSWKNIKGIPCKTGKNATVKVLSRFYHLEGKGMENRIPVVATSKAWVVPEVVNEAARERLSNFGKKRT